MWLLFNADKNEDKKSLKQRISDYLSRHKEIQINSLDEVKEQANQLPNLYKDLNTSIRIWLPNVMYECINEHISESYSKLSVASEIRHVLIDHCYGAIAKKQLHQKSRSRIYFSISSTAIKKCIDIEMLVLGKKNTPSKISCNKKLKDDLEVLAKLHSCSLSEYIRNVLYKHYFGNGFITNLDLVEDTFEDEE
ncbi:hypothetical protein A4G19_11315 [Pasteurellaceae bacterium Macca]|nr:hypothetical protein [Pasteurellaceae bacterium Macca]